MTSSRAKEVLYDSETMLRLVANELHELQDDAEQSAMQDATQDLADTTPIDASSSERPTDPGLSAARAAADDAARHRLSP